MKVVNARTLQITITKPAAYFLEILAISSVVFDPAVVAGKNDQNSGNYLTNTCSGNQGAGPFRFVCHDRSSTLHSFYSGTIPKYTLVPNPYYYGPKPHVRLELISTGAGNANGSGRGTITDNYKAYVAGTLDMTAVPIPYRDRWKGRSSQYHEYPSSLVTYLSPNVHLAPFDNVHCRLAVAYALDRTLLATNIQGGTERPTYAILPKGMLGYADAKDNPHYSPARARAELAKCPGRTVPFELVYFTGPSNDNRFSAIRSMLNSVGMNAKLKPVSFQDWVRIINQPLDNTKTQIVYSDWTQDYPDPYDYFLLLPSTGYAGACCAYGGWHNAAYSRLVDRAAKILNRKTRASLYIQAQHLVLSQGAVIPISQGINSALIKPYVHGLVGTETYPWLQPAGGDWANVSVSKHRSSRLSGPYNPGSC